MSTMKEKDYADTSLAPVPTPPESPEVLMERVYEDVTDDPTMNRQPLEVYLHYAQLERAKEAADTGPIPDSPWGVLFKRMTGRKSQIVAANQSVPTAATGAGRFGGLFRTLTGRNPTSAPPQRGSHDSNATEKTMQTVHSVDKLGSFSSTAVLRSVPTNGEGDLTPEAHERIAGFAVTPEEKATAYRLLRVASWQVVFFLIMTDVLGWYTAPMAFSLLGFGPGVLVYTSFYLLAFGSGQILWRMYLNLDSQRYPVKCYADVGERTYGPIAKHLFNILQSVQLVFNVAMLLIMDGQGLAEIIDFKFCYIGLTTFFCIVIACLTHVKTLRGLSWFTNINLWVNIIVMVLTMVGVSLYDPVPAQSGHADLSEPIQTSAWVPATSLGWASQVSGMQLAVFAYGGALIFVEFMSEMRRPRDFWKAALAAQSLCWLLYMLFGMFVYGMQGQYTNILPTVNIASRTFQGITNILGLLCVCVIATLYANIGCKVFYRNVMRGYFKAPSLTSAKSNLYWSGTVILYFIIAWVVGNAIPNITDLNTIVGAACILQFTYTIPPALLVGHWVQTDALSGDQPWQPGVAPWSNRVDSWKDMSRWKRGFAKYWYLKLALVIASLGFLSLCGLGIYSGVISAEASFASGFSTSFSCRAPGQPAANSTSS